jgi:eukaryotic-like serine/threonine-protein kinase
MSCGVADGCFGAGPFTNVECPKCGKHTRVKREFGPYTLMRRHAVGGMSMVFAAHDNTLDREVALKILSEEFSADERRIAAFEEEARLTASFSHPNVVRVFTTGRASAGSTSRWSSCRAAISNTRSARGKIPELEMLPLAIEVAQGSRPPMPPA